MNWEDFISTSGNFAFCNSIKKILSIFLNNLKSIFTGYLMLLINKPNIKLTLYRNRDHALARFSPMYFHPYLKLEYYMSHSTSQHDLQLNQLGRNRLNLKWWHVKMRFHIYVRLLNTCTRWWNCKISIQIIDVCWIPALKLYPARRIWKT